MQSCSILFDRPEAVVAAASPDEPDFFLDLKLDQIAAAIVAGRDDQQLRALLYTPLRDAETVGYRQEVMRDLSLDRVKEAVKAFSRAMEEVHQNLKEADLPRERFRNERLFLEAAVAYCGAAVSLERELTRSTLASRGLQGFGDYLREYVRGDRFTSLAADTRLQCEGLATVKYNLHLEVDHVTVSRHGEGADYAAEIEGAFAKFRREATKDYQIRIRESSGMNLVEARIFDLVARLYPKVLSGLEDYCLRHKQFVDECLERFDREAQFYLSFLDYIEPLTKSGLGFCFPRVSDSSKGEYARQAFDLALAAKLNSENATVVPNDFHLDGPERVIVVTGPNQGGKTTFARTFGQLHYLASLGYPVPGSEAQLFLSDRIFTHFERQERVEDQWGKLEDELLRARNILQQATGDSIIIMNEGFTSTTLSDALLLGTKVLGQVVRMGLLCVYITFVDELASLSEATVSMVATVDEDDPSLRTFRVVREPASGLAYAAAIANRYGLGYQRLKERLAS